ncbi:NosR/NirI family protein [Methylobacterium sp. WSM2598]|uniref:NosR/NirI family protein n=1 Tax=Methylobacterium sp. WSM2598 TaxID=398261 RepID=UPI00055BECFB|nr:NosR/NirI family protein [Methylobacterium sp. WSM2598]
MIHLWGALAAMAAGTSPLTDYLAKVQPGEFFAGADRFGSPQGDPPIVPVYTGSTLKGYVYLNTDFSSATGYSGKPIHVLIGIDPQGVLRGLKLVDHKEPIVLIGIPEKRIVEAINTLVGKGMRPVASGAEPLPQVDIVSGATVTVLVIGDSAVRSAVKLIKSGRLGGAAGAGAAAAATVTKTVDMDRSEVKDWQTLLGDGSIRRLHLSVADINEAFAKSGNAAAASHPEPGAPDDTFIDLYVALVSVPTIGRSLLGEDGYARLRSQLRPGQQAIVVAGEGAYSFKGAAYVRGGIFDRIELLQDGSGVRFRDRNHTRLGALEGGAPDLPEIGLFTIPPDFAFDPTEPWQLRLLVQRAVGARDKAFLTFDVGYTLPDGYVRREQRAVTAAEQPAPAGAPGPAAAPAAAVAGSDATTIQDEPLWIRIWRSKSIAIGITAAALLVLTGIFFFQDALVKHPHTYVWVRRAFLLFTLVWLGWYANAQLSVVNILTFTSALVTGFHWDFFLAAPLIFILCAAIAAGLLFWGRGPFCGWLCPFGALQELTNTLAQWLKVPQLTIPWGLHERLWPIKYVIFLGLFGVSLYSVAMAETLAEVEPFKTAIILKFVRDWPFTLYAVALLAAGLFVERFFCRYLCPLGAALAIPGRMRTFEWLKRWPECGSPCQRCAKECPVQSIHPEGHINVNECIYCMHCQELYHDDHRCPHMIQVRLKREKFEALSSPSQRTGGRGAKPSVTVDGRPVPATAPSARSPS